MADPLSIAAGITGILTFAAQLTREVITLISEVEDAPSEVLDLKFELKHLASLIQSAHDLLSRYELHPDDQPLETTVVDCVERCQAVMEDIKSQLDFFFRGWSPFRAISWVVIRRDRVKNHRDRLRDSRAMFELGFTVLSAHLLGKGQQEIMEEIARGAEKLRKEVRNSKEARRLQRRLREDVESVAASGGGRRESFSAVVDAELPMRRYLEGVEEEGGTGFDPPERADTGESTAQVVPPLLQAAQAGNLKQVRALAALGASPSSQLPDGRTALHFCAVYDDDAMAEVLLNHGADVYAKDAKSRSPLRIAISSQSFSVAALLVRRGSKMEYSVPVLLDTIRTSKGSAGLADFLSAVRERLDISGGPFLLHEAIEYEDDDVLTILLDAGFDPNQRDVGGISPIHHAIIRARKPTVKILLDRGADKDDFLPPDTRNWLRMDNKWHRRFLPPMLDTGIVPLGTASRVMRDAEMVRLLLDAGANPNFPYSDGGGMLMGLCAPEYKEVAKMLVDAGADVNRRNNAGGHTPMWFATGASNHDLMRYLVDHGADVSPVCEAVNNWTPLHAAIQKRDRWAVTFLVERGANLDAIDAHGRRPIDLVEAWGDFDVRATFQGKMGS